ncbi:GspE/PulE family protein [Phycisphaerales bacterium AB-hyl4]|uniref:GspE/PulE family protein n=1 Tax=Natronomicrosphaera hydrolytica TaxID=3242702 RepID=A0ABV4U5B5_9BACT
MIYVVAEAQAVMLMSVVKPLLAIVLLGVWAWTVSKLDKDAEYFHLKRQMWNLAHIGAAVVGFGLLLLIPIYLVGLLLCLVIVGGEIFGYAYQRNQLVPANARWTFSLESFTRRLESYQEAQALRRASISLVGKDGNPKSVPRGDDQDAGAHQVLESVLDFALPRGAQRVEIAVDSKQAAFTVSIDGVKYPQPTIEPEMAMKFIDYLKRAAGLDVDDRRKKQIGRVKIDAHELGGHRLEVETAGSTRGLVMTLDIDPHHRMDTPIEKLGMLESQRKVLQPVLEERGGVVLVAAPPRQGTTTTLYSLLQAHDPYTSSINAFTEDPDFEIEGISHKAQPEGQAANDYNEQLAILLRSDPDVVLVSRLADRQTAKLLTQNYEHGRFYVPLAAADTLEALKIWIKQVGEYRAAGESISAIISQRLVRKLCPTCRMAYKPDPAALKKLNLPVDKVSKLYRASGKVMENNKPVECDTCFGLGYRGRVGVFEVMVIDAEGRKLIANNQLDRLRSHVRKQKMLWLQEAALAKVAYEGVTDIKEITRVLGDKFGSGGSRGRSGAPVADSSGSGSAARQPEVKQG